MKSKTATFSSRAAEVREIAKGIFDTQERLAVLRLVGEVERLSKEAALRQH